MGHDPPLITEDTADSAGAATIESRVLAADGVFGTPNERAGRKRRRRAAQMNLLDHEGVLTNSGKALLLAGAGFGMIAQGFLLSSFLSLFLGFFGFGAAMTSALQVFFKTAKPVIDQMGILLHQAKALGLPVDVLKTKAETLVYDKVTTFSIPNRIQKYAILTLMSGGAGSFMATAASIGLALTAMPDLFVTGLTTVQGVIFMQQGLALVREDIARFHFTHDPRQLIERFNQGLAVYEISKNRSLEDTVQTLAHTAPAPTPAPDPAIHTVCRRQKPRPKPAIVAISSVFAPFANQPACVPDALHDLINDFASAVMDI